MSDWVLDDSSSQTTSQQPSSDWVVETPAEERGKPLSFGEALAQAPSKIYEDVTGGIKNFATNIPQYYQTAKSEIPGIFGNKNIFNSPNAHPGRQAMAGLAELGQNVFNTPHDIVNYLSKRLNLVPEDFNRMVQMGRMPSDTQQMINQTFGTPQQPGEALFRGAFRNAPSIAAGKGIASLVNPLRYTSKGIAKNVLREEARQVAEHSKQYNKIWDLAQKTGFNSVPYDSALMKNYSDVIKKFYPSKSTSAFEEFIRNPTLQNAQKAQSDLGNLRRSIEEKSRTTPLLETERHLHDALSGAEKHIEGNMFKNATGQTNNALQDLYKKVSNSYRENVVPYRYNNAIQKYKNKEMTASELVNSLSHGEFAAKKGMKHPAIKVNKLLPKAGLVGGGIVAGKELFGAGEPDTNQQY